MIFFICRFKYITLFGAAILFMPLSGYCDSSQLFDALLTKKQESQRQNSTRIKLESSLIVKRLEALKPNEAEANINIVESFFDSGGYAEKGDAAQLGIDGGVIQIDGFAPDRRIISAYMAAIENDHVGKTELNLFKPEDLNVKNNIRFGIRVIVGAIGSDTQTAAERFVPVTPEIFVFDPSQFHAYTGPDVSMLMPSRYDFPAGSSDFSRRRIGSIPLSKNRIVYIDELSLPMGIEYELIDVTNGSLIKVIYSGMAGASALRFTGDGSVYVTDKNSCRHQATRKYVLQGKELNETSQPLLYVGTDSRLAGDTKLFADQYGKKLVATLQSGTIVTVIGRNFGFDDNSLETILIKTPLGLTGWIVSGKSGGFPLLDSCG